MAAAPKIDDKTWIKAYYKAHADGLSLTQFAENIGEPMKSSWSRMNYMRKRKGIELPRLARAPHGPRPAAEKRPKTVGRPANSTKPIISAEEFVRIWQTAASKEEVIEKTGLSLEMTRGKAAKLRKIGVPLKKFNSMGTKLDVQALIALAESLQPPTPQ